MSRMIHCSNCDQEGHMFRKCKEPVTSYGIICIKTDDNLLFRRLLHAKHQKVEGCPNIEEILDIMNDKFQILCIRRKHSYAYAELIRMGFLLEDKEQIMKILNKLTKEEQEYMIHHCTLEEIWNHFWIRRMNKDFLRMREKLTLLIQGKNMKNEDLPYTLKSLLLETTSCIQEQEWSFPKGRKNRDESTISCAIREFCEETDIKNYHIKILPIQHEQETFLANNQVKYRHMYYFALYKSKKYIKFNKDNKYQQAEISRIAWLTPKEVIACMHRDTNDTRERIHILHKLTTTLFHIYSELE